MANEGGLMGIMPKYSSSFLVEGEDLPSLKADILQLLDARLYRMHVRHLDTEPASLTFSGPSFGMRHLHVLGQIRRGEIRIAESEGRLRVTYEITFIRFLLLTWFLIPLFCSLPGRLGMFLTLVSAFSLFWLLSVYFTFYITVQFFEGLITRAVLDAGGRICDR